ncbi:hypothetical protein J2W49_003994 [Hydrogenophaga palleronii]|uniref:Uncharacterized protein n=1 Tax=Hydrogenophaga palleronii TaxID=65655 RepID=A0ABU1WRS6_9BURK|nr:hypothetical protein [Hydrogenophaga palleronii]MDR7152018.1 hypothetical protein [Hydrogenophaga palleronii]
MNPRRRSNHTKNELPRIRPGEQMGEQRYQELMGSLNHFFREADQDPQIPSGIERQQAIEEINAMMARYGLTVEDICK